MGRLQKQEAELSNDVGKATLRLRQLLNFGAPEYMANADTNKLIDCC